MDKVWVAFTEVDWEGEAFLGVYSSPEKAWYKLARAIVSHPFYDRNEKPERQEYAVGGDTVISYYDYRRGYTWIAQEEVVDNMLLSDKLFSRKV